MCQSQPSHGLAQTDYGEHKALFRDLQLTVLVLVEPVEISLKHPRPLLVHAALLDTALHEGVHDELAARRVELQNLGP